MYGRNAHISNTLAIIPKSWYSGCPYWGSEGDSMCRPAVSSYIYLFPYFPLIDYLLPTIFYSGYFPNPNLGGADSCLR